MNDALLLAKILFPDAEAYHFVNTIEVTEAYAPDIIMASYLADDLPDKIVEFDRYKLRLEPIADGVWAGMSVWSRAAYICTTQKYNTW